MMHPLSDQGSERATSGGGGKVVTRDDRTHVVWQDSTEEGYFNRTRTLDRATGEFTDPVTLNEAEDNHARPNLLVDGDGYLHVLLSGHNSPVLHRRSRAPNDASEWTDPVAIGEGTYPIPVSGPDGTIYVAMRSADRWNGVDFYVKPPGESWRQRTKLVSRHPDLDGYGAFHTGLAVADDGTLYAVIDFYESEGVYEQRGLHQAVTAMQSPDGGRTWTTADGTEIETPARPPRMDVIARDRAESRIEDKPQPVIKAQGSIVLDRHGRPHVLYLDHRHAPGQVVHAWTDGDGAWSRAAIHALPETFPDHRPTGCRGSLTVREDGVMFVLLSVVPLGDGWENGLPTRELGFTDGADRRLAWLVSRDDGSTWEAGQPAIDHAINEPNLERPVGDNRIDADRLPGFVFFDGASRYPDDDEIIQNTVYFIDPSASGEDWVVTEGATGASRPTPYRSEDSWYRAVPEDYHDRPAFSFPEPHPALPNVLILGDSISMSYTPGVRDRLEDVATVYRAPDNCRSTRGTLDRIETYLGDVDWDVILFNWGIHDVTLVDEGGEADEHGQVQVPIGEYRANLERIVRRLKATGAVPICASTTPVSDDTAIRDNHQVEAYNEVAATIMDAHRIPVVDLYRVVDEHDERLWSNGVHFSDRGAAVLAESVADAIRAHLDREFVEERFSPGGRNGR